MASLTDKPTFKACGLCATIVIDALELKQELRVFLLDFLDLNETKQENLNDHEILPSKICVNCYQESSDAKKFKERCLKSIAKFNTEEGKNIPKSMIIGWSPEKVEADQLNSEQYNHLNANDRGTENQPQFIIRNSNEVDNSHVSRAPRSKTKAKKDFAIKAQERNKNDAQIESVKENRNFSSNKYTLGVQPVVEISWNERQLGEISLKRCNVEVNSMLLASFQGTPKALSPKTNLVINTLQPPTYDSNLKEHGNDNVKRSDAKVKFKQESPRLDHKRAQAKSINKSTPKKIPGYVIETVDASGKVVLENGKPVINEINCEKTVPARISKHGRIIYTVNSSSSKEKTTPTKLDQQSRFGRSIKNPRDQSHFSTNTPPSNSRIRKRLSVGRSISPTSSPLRNSSENCEPLRKSPKVPKRSFSTPNKSDKEEQLKTTRSQSKFSSPKKRRTESEAKESQHKKQVTLKDSSMKFEDLQESYPAQGPYQCELCQSITDSKEEFVDHIKTKHLEDVDAEVLNTLNSDLRKARRKIELNNENFRSCQDLPLTSEDIYKPTS